MNIIGKRLRVRHLQALVGSAVNSTFSTSETFMTGNSVGYIERMQEAWKADPNSVHVSWNAYFTNLNKGITPAFVEPPTLGMAATKGAQVSPLLSVGASAKDVEDHLKIFQLINAYQLKGHEIAEFDPLSTFTHQLKNRTER